MKGIRAVVYVPVRKNTAGEEWPDFYDAAYSEEEAKDRAQGTDHDTPEWSRLNPVVRIACFKCDERPLDYELDPYGVPVGGPCHEARP